MRHTDRQPYRITVTRDETGDTADHRVSSACAMRALELVSRDHLGVLLASPDGPHERIAADLTARAVRARQRANETPDDQARQAVRLQAGRYAFAAAILRELAREHDREVTADLNLDPEAAPAAQREPDPPQLEAPDDPGDNGAHIVVDDIPPARGRPPGSLDPSQDEVLDAAFKNPGRWLRLDAYADQNQKTASGRANRLRRKARRHEAPSPLFGGFEVTQRTIDGRTVPFIRFDRELK